MNKQQLASKIWESANKMRSKIEANEYKDTMDASVDLKSFITELTKKLYHDQASVMVGSGFSKNADGKSETIPDWNGLGDKFYERLYGGSEKKPEKSYLDVLKLAEEVELKYERAELIKL
jgi:type I restriction-modification system DNA methylase subunit